MTHESARAFARAFYYLTFQSLVPLRVSYSFELLESYLPTYFLISDEYPSQFWNTTLFYRFGHIGRTPSKIHHNTKATYTMNYSATHTVLSWLTRLTALILLLSTINCTNGAKRPEEAKRPGEANGPGEAKRFGEKKVSQKDTEVKLALCVGGDGYIYVVNNGTEAVDLTQYTLFRFPVELENYKGEKVTGHADYCKANKTTLKGSLSSGKKERLRRPLDRYSSLAKATVDCSILDKGGKEVAKERATWEAKLQVSATLNKHFSLVSTSTYIKNISTAPIDLCGISGTRKIYQDGKREGSIDITFTDLSSRYLAIGASETFDGDKQDHKAWRVEKGSDFYVTVEITDKSSGQLLGAAKSAPTSF